MSEDIKCIYELLSNELDFARSKYANFASAHEGYATILEELDELWDEIKKKPHKRSNERMRREAIQIAAMAVRFIHDVCDRDEIE